MTGGNKFSRGIRRSLAAPTRFGANFEAKTDRAKSDEDAAKAGFLMENEDAVASSQLKMAKSSAESARQSSAMKGLDDETQLAAIGQQGSENIGLAAAIDSQKKSAEKQTIQELQGLRGAQNNDQLEKGLNEAIQSGDIYAAQANENILATRGEGGVATLARVIKNADADVEKGADWTKNQNLDWAVMRTELARNMSGDVMSQHEVLKNWAVSTELEMDDKGNAVTGDDGKHKLVTKRPKLDDNGNAIIGKDGKAETKPMSVSYEQAHNKLINDPGTKDMKLAKFAKQHADLQQELVDNDSISIETMEFALSPNNRTNFKDSTLKEMQKKVDAANAAKKAAAGTGGSTTSSSSTQSNQSQNFGTTGAQQQGATFNVPHNNQASPAGGSAQQQASNVNNQTTNYQTTNQTNTSSQTINQSFDPYKGRTSMPSGTSNFQQSSSGLFTPGGTASANSTPPQAPAASNPSQTPPAGGTPSAAPTNPTPTPPPASPGAPTPPRPNFPRSTNLPGSGTPPASSSSDDSSGTS